MGCRMRCTPCSIQSPGSAPRPAATAAPAAAMGAAAPNSSPAAPPLHPPVLQAHVLPDIVFLPLGTQVYALNEVVPLKPRVVVTAAVVQAAREGSRCAQPHARLLHAWTWLGCWTVGGLVPAHSPGWLRRLRLAVRLHSLSLLGACTARRLPACCAVLCRAGGAAKGPGPAAVATPGRRSGAAGLREGSAETDRPAPASGPQRRPAAAAAASPASPGAPQPAISPAALVQLQQWQLLQQAALHLRLSPGSTAAVQWPSAQLLSLRTQQPPQQRQQQPQQQLGQQQQQCQQLAGAPPWPVQQQQPRGQGPGVGQSPQQQEQQPGSPLQQQSATAAAHGPTEVRVGHAPVGVGHGTVGESCQPVGTPGRSAAATGRPDPAAPATEAAWLPPLPQPAGSSQQGAQREDSEDEQGS